MFFCTDTDRVNVIGLGRIGLPLACEMANSGFKVSGVDCDKNLLESLSKAVPVNYEPGLGESLVGALAKGLSLSAEIPPARTHIVAVPTPVNYDDLYLRQVCQQLVPVLTDGDLVIIRSTLAVGTCEKVILPMLRSSNCRIHLAHCPERSVEGDVFRGLREHPQIIGGSSSVAVESASQIFSKVCREIVPVSSLKAAEMVKLAGNSYRFLNFAFANELAQTCLSADIDVDEVVDAVNFGLTRPVLSGPGPVGGPCLVKDAIAFSNCTDSEIVASAQKANSCFIDRVMEKLAKMIDASQVNKIAIMGLAFKGRPETDNWRNTPAVEIVASAKRLFSSARVVVFDPLIKTCSIDCTEAMAKDWQSAVLDSDLIIIQNNHSFWTSVDWQNLLMESDKQTYIFDFWNQLDGLNSCRYLTLGKLVHK